VRGLRFVISDRRQTPSCVASCSRREPILSDSALPKGSFVGDPMSAVPSLQFLTRNLHFREHFWDSYK
jgi:hypothetical protein